MKAFIFDTETSGIPSTNLLALKSQPSVVEVYACILDLETGEIVEELDSLIKPPAPIPPETTKIHHITDEMVADAPVWNEIALQIIEMISKADVVIAHNLAFDMQMLDLEFERLGQKIDWPHGICTVAASIGIKGYRLDLGSLYQEMTNTQMPPGNHRAKADVMSLVECVKQMNNRGMI